MLSSDYKSSPARFPAITFEKHYTLQRCAYQFAHKADLSDEATKFILDLTQYMRLNGKTGRWDELVEHEDPKAKDVIFDELSEYALAKMQSVQRMVEKVRTNPLFTELSDQIERLADFRTAASDVGRTVRKLAGRQNTDIGHGISAEMYDLFDIHYVPSPVTKSEGSTLIFEDDPIQSRIYRRVCGEFSPFDFSERRLATDSLEAALTAASNPAYSLFILDMDNFGNKDAGYQVAREVILRRKASPEQFLSKTIIILWSSDRKLVEKAYDKLHKEFEDESVCYFDNKARPHTDKQRIFLRSAGKNTFEFKFILHFMNDTLKR